MEFCSLIYSLKYTFKKLYAVVLVLCILTLSMQPIRLHGVGPDVDLRVAKGHRISFFGIPVSTNLSTTFNLNDAAARRSWQEIAGYFLFAVGGIGFVQSFKQERYLTREQRILTRAGTCALIAGGLYMAIKSPKVR